MHNPDRQSGAFELGEHPLSVPMDMFAKMKELDTKSAQDLFGSLSNRVVEVMAATPQQLAIESAEKAGLTKVSEAIKSMEAKVEEADPLGIMGPNSDEAMPAPGGENSSWSTSWPAASWQAFGSAEKEPDSAAPVAASNSSGATGELETTIQQLRQQLEVRPLAATASSLA